jgi:hypothetical protein
VYHPSVPLTRRAKAAIVLTILVVLGFLALPYFDALGFIIRAADLPGAAASVASWRTTPVTRDADITVPTRSGNIPGRF